MNLSMERALHTWQSREKTEKRRARGVALALIIPMMSVQAEEELDVAKCVGE